MPNADFHIVAQTSMLIRRPPAACYRAFVQPEMLTQFWLSHASAPLEVGKAVRWDFMVPGATDEVTAKVLKPGERIEVEWSDGSPAIWRFTPMAEGATRVEVEQGGFSGTPDERAAAAIETASGFTIVLCDLKTLLETGTSANLVRDKAVLIQGG